MERWSLKNDSCPIDFSQFKRLTEEFKQTVEYSFQSDCIIQIRYTDDDNGKKDILVEIDTMDETDEKLWNEFGHIKVLFYPKNQDPATAKKILYAHIEFKGVAERTATYYVQCENKDSNLKNQVINNHKQMKASDGLKSNEFEF